MDMVQKLLKNVLEVRGVDGACLLDLEGRLVHNALPEFFLEEFFDDLSRRITNFYATVEENYLACDEFLLKYPQKSVVMRRSKAVIFVAIIDPGANLVTLRMVTNLILKNVTSEVIESLPIKTSKTAKEEPKQEPIEVAEEVEEAKPKKRSFFSSKPDKAVPEEPKTEEAASPNGSKRRMYRGTYY